MSTKNMLDIYKKHGRFVILSVNASPLRDKKGPFSGMLATFEDITDRKQMEEKLRKSETTFRSLFE